MNKEIKFRAFDFKTKALRCVRRMHLDIDGSLHVQLEGYTFFLEGDEVNLTQYTGLKDKNGTESAHFDIANNKYLLYLDLVYGLHLIDISNGAIIRYKEGTIDEITGNYFEQHEEISENCKRSIDQFISQASRAM